MATAQKQTSGMVAGVILAKVKQEVLNEYLTKFGLDASGTLEERVQRLADHQSKETPPEQIADCTVCKGECDLRLPACPFCGEGDDNTEPAPAPAAASSKAAASSNKEDTTMAAKPTKKKRSQQRQPHPNTTAKEKAAAEKAKKEAAKAAAKAAKSDKGKAHIAEVVNLPTAEGEKKLDSAVQNINALKTQAVVSYWQLGHALFETYEQRLYTQRRTEAGGVAYKSWQQFCNAELGMSPQHSFKLMDVATTFSREDVATIGVAKLGVMLKLPPETRDSMIERAKAGMPLSEVTKEVRRLAGNVPVRDTGRERSGKSNRTAKAAKAAKAKKDAAKAAKGDEITAVLQVGRVKLPLFARGSKADDPKRATTLAQDPHCEELLINGVKVLYRVVKEAKGLALVIERRRES